RGIDRGREQIAFSRARALGQRLELGIDLACVARALEPRELVDLQASYRGIVDLEYLDRPLGFRPILIDPDHRLDAGIDPRMGLGSGLLDAELRQAGTDGLGHAAERRDLLDVPPGAAGEFIAEALDMERPAPRIDHPSGPALLLQEELRIAGDP